MITRIRSAYSKLSLKNKFFVSILAVILVISGTIALLARWILVSGLTNELEMRGTAVARSIAARSASHILENNMPELLTLIFDEKQLRERKHLVAYIYVAAPDGRVLCHTFTYPFPQRLVHSNPLPETVQHSVKLVSLYKQDAYDIAVPVTEGLYRIGTVHVGLSKMHIDSLVTKLRVMFLGFISAVIVITFWVSHRLARTITDPVVRLTRISDDLSRGQFASASELGSLQDNGDEHDWDITNCPAYSDTDLPCWHFDEQHRDSVVPSAGRLLHRCPTCLFYMKREGDEVTQLTDSFRNMAWSIRLYRRRLGDSETTYRSLFNSGPDPVFVVSCTDQRLLDANPRAEELYGYTRDELVGMEFASLGPDQQQECFAMFEAEDTTGVHTPRVLHRKKNGDAFFVNVTACPISYRGRPALIVAATDVTAMVEKDAQLVQAAKMRSLGEMSAGIAHEVNQPLNAIRMGAELLGMSAGGSLKLSDAQLGEIVTEIIEQVDRASDIIANLRAFGRKADLHDEAVDINNPVRSVISLLRRQFILQNVEIELVLTEGLPLVRAHDNKLQQVLFNIITNARDAIVERNRLAEQIERAEHAGQLELSGKAEQTKQAELAAQGKEAVQGRIVVTTGMQDDYVCVAVADNGTGMPAHIAEKVFEPFFTTKETGQGMGLGLAITNGIIRDYNGQVLISDNADNGTTFTILFPTDTKQPRSLEGRPAIHSDTRYS